MINFICNYNNENNIDVFSKIAILEKSFLPYFNHLTSNTTIKDIITNLPDTAQVLITDLLPVNLKVNSTNKIKNAGVLRDTKIEFLITPQDENLLNLLETYINKEVVVLIYKVNSTHLYGTSAQPLLFNYQPINSNEAKELKGYQINIEGSNYGAEKIFEEIVFNIFSRGLAFQLAQEL